MVISMEYVDNATGSRILVEQVASKAIYIGVPAGDVMVPPFRLGLAVKAVDVLGRLIERLLPGQLLFLSVSWSALGFTGNVSLVVELVKDGTTVLTARVPLKPGSEGSTWSVVLVPWVPGSYQVRVRLVLDDLASIVQLLG
jgi:hypothetical protein